MDHDAKDTDYLKDLGPLLEDYSRWFGDVLATIAYPDEGLPSPKTPSGYEDWKKKAEEASAVNPSILRNLTELYEHMVMEGRAINKVITDGKKPSIKIFESFKNRYDSFFRQIRQLERNSAMEEGGMDEQTGLRSAKSIEGDMKRELERLDRQGTAFCQVMLRIDGFARFDSHDVMLKQVVKVIGDTIRPFDDAYYLGQGHFLISMKQADIIGAEAGVKRIRMELAQSADNQENPITLSFCLMEPVVGDESEKILKNMQQDLEEHANETDAVLKFKEISELERFVGNMN